MPKRNSAVKPHPNSATATSKSPRFRRNNQSPPPEDPKTPEPKSRTRRFTSAFSPLSSPRKIFSKRITKKCNDIFPGKIEECGWKNLEKSSNVSMRSGAEKDGFSLRRSPRLSAKNFVIEICVEKEFISRSKQKGSSSIGKRAEGRSENEKRVTHSSICVNEKAFDSDKQAGDKSKIEKMMIDSSVQRNACKNLKKNKKDVEDFDSCKQAVVKGEIQKRVTRSSIRGNGCKITNKRKKDDEGLDSGKQAEDKSKTAKRVTRSSILENNNGITKKKKKIEECSDSGKQAESTRRVIRRKAGVKEEEGLPIPERALLVAKSGRKTGAKLERRSEEKSLVVKGGNNLSMNVGEKLGTLMVVDGGEVKERDFSKVKKSIGVKRKRNRCGDGGDGWTEDQEMALQRAYFSAKPTPNFWKKVAKLVPGKSAQDCFNKIHADHLTPPQPRTRSRATKTDISSFSLSASKLLGTENPKIKRITSRKRKGHLAQKAVRQLLQKNYTVNQGEEADLFSVLESTFNPSAVSLEQNVKFCTPPSEKGKSGYLKQCGDKSSSARRKQLSRFGGSCEASLASPPVLKPVKNKALHEKYIDQLHCREAKRKVAHAKEKRKEEFNQKTEAFKIGKDALILGAKDIIHKFQQRKDIEKCEYSDDDDNDNYEDEDEFKISVLTV